MRLRTAVIGMFALAALTGCGGNTASGPYGGGSGGGSGSGGGGGYGGGGGGYGGGAGAGATSVAVGSGIMFTSSQNGSSNPAVDTVAVGGTMTWIWGANSSAYSGHSVQSQGSPSFASSAVQSSGTYSVTFTTAGTYKYDCAVHGSAMTGTIVVR
jgi:plastocyanin